jgi:chemotaxis signal transduction protein
VVDRLRDLRVIDTALEPAPSNLDGAVAVLLKGIAATPTGTVRVLDADAVIAAEPLRALAKKEDQA